MDERVEGGFGDRQPWLGNTYAQNTLVFDHIHRRDAQSEGIQHYSQRPLDSHETIHGILPNLWRQELNTRKDGKSLHFLVCKSTNYTEDLYSTIKQRPRQSIPKKSTKGIDDGKQD